MIHLLDHLVAPNDAANEYPRSSSSSAAVDPEMIKGVVKCRGIIIPIRTVCGSPTAGELGCLGGWKVM